MQEAIIEASTRAPGSEVTNPALGNQGMNVRISFQIPPEGMRDADKTRIRVFGLVKLEERTQDDILDRMEQAVKEWVVLRKKAKGFFGDCKDTMSVVAGNEFTGHTKEASLVIHVATGRIETAFTGRGNKFKVTIMRAAKESASKRRIMTTDHPVDAIQNILAGADDVLNIFKVVRKNSLEDVLFIHKNTLR